MVDGLSDDALLCALLMATCPQGDGLTHRRAGVPGQGPLACQVEQVCSKVRHYGSPHSAVCRAAIATAIFCRDVRDEMACLEVYWLYQ